MSGRQPKPSRLPKLSGQVWMGPMGGQRTCPTPDQKQRPPVLITEGLCLPSALVFQPPLPDGSSKADRVSLFHVSVQRSNAAR